MALIQILPSMITLADRLYTCQGLFKES